MTQYQLTGAEMAAVQALCRDGNVPPEERMTSAVKIVLGLGLFLQAETIRLMELQIPESQWKEIAGWLTEAGSSIDGVNLALSWMNYGPSSYKETADASPH